jgi:16S rRNA (cytosine1402-N4)-methyltransferase
MNISASNERPAHISVLYQEIIHALRPRSPGLYVDLTVGAGGHTWGILVACAPSGQLLGLDVDPQALALTSQRLAVFQNRLTLVEASYISLTEQLSRIGWQQVDGIVLDLGVSSMQLDQADRGFSFMSDGPLDMRFSPRQTTTAATLVNSLPESDLAEILWTYGEERNSRRIARAIVQRRPFTTTHELAQVIRKAAGKPTRGIHPATRSFQALRIAVNHELDALGEVLPQAVEALKPGGRLAVIAFHSLEDRIVKQTFRRESRDCICPPEQPICTCGHRARLREVNRQPITAGEDEISANTRSRSAKLRIVEKLNLA